MNKKQIRIEQQIKWTLWTLAGAVALGELVAAAAVWSTGREWVAMLWGGAFTVMGFVLGFLFGVPRAQSADDKSKSPLQVNTNLEQISDWLTKLITGAALASLKELPTDIKLGAVYISQSLSGCPQGPCPSDSQLASTGGAIFCYFLALGFLFGYLATRTFFSRLFAASDSTPTVDEAVDNLPSGSTTALSKAALNLDQPPPTLNSDAAAAASVLQALPVSADASPDSLLAQAKAKLMSGKWDESIQAYKAAIERKPADAATLLDYSYALNRTGHNPLEVQSQLDTALDLVRAGGDKDLKRRVYEGATYIALYAPAPEGYERAIRLGVEYTKDSSNHPSGAVFVNLACGYGQKVRWLAANQPAQDPKPFRDAALEAARGAINLGTQWKQNLHDLMLPSDVQAARGENDLQVFANDPDFRTLLG